MWGGFKQHKIVFFSVCLFFFFVNFVVNILFGWGGGLDKKSKADNFKNNKTF